jgi:predicted nucleic acid-binding protein
MLIYCDSVILIYWLDHTGPFQLLAENRMTALQKAGDRIAISDLTRLECRVGPLKRKDVSALGAFDSFFARPELKLLPLTSTVFDRATQMRADLGFKTPDALHLAAAIEAGCDRFLTNDNRLSRCTDITVEVLV